MHSIIADVTMLAVDDYALKFVRVSFYFIFFILKNKIKWKLFCDNNKIILTSTPVCAIICAARNDGRPRKVIIGFEPARRALRRRSFGLCPVLVIAEKLGMVPGCKLDRGLVTIVVHSPDLGIREAEGIRVYDSCTLFTK